MEKEQKKKEMIKSMFNLNKKVAHTFKDFCKEKGLNMSKQVELMIARFMEEYK